MFSCLLCNCNKYSDYYKKTRENDSHKIVQCLVCTHIQLYPIDFNAKEYYDNDIQDNNVLNIGNRKREEWLEMVNSQSNRRINYLSNIIDILVQKHNTINICDIGGGYGHFCKNLKLKYGKKINVTLIEPGKLRINKVQNKKDNKINNINLVNAMLNKEISNQLKEQFHLVTCFHVLEHVFAPNNFLKYLLNIIKKDCYCCIEVPNENNELVKLNNNFKDKVWYLNCHVSYFTPNNFKKLLYKFNKNILKFEGFERYGLFNFLYWLYYDRPQKEKCNYYTDKSLHYIEDIWISNRNQNKISDSMYAILKKDL